MIYVCICACEIIFMLWSYIFVKTYQLSGYKIAPFFKSVCQLNLAFGDKNKLVFTRRMIRFVVVLALLSFGLFFVVNYFIKSIYLKIFDILLIFLLQPLVLTLAHLVICPIEKAIKLHYIRKATRLLKNKRMIKIGITGSYGKTSTKNILAAMLEKKYKVCTTPKNYNTEMGLTKTILSLPSGQEVFIAEMGARHRGDIKVLAKMVEPDYGIITSIGEQHLETFKTLQNIKDTKFELAENIIPGGIMVFNGDSEATRELYERFEGNKLLTCDRCGYAYAENICMGREGSKFDLILDGKRYSAKTRLLGRCNIDNIVTAAAMADVLKVKAVDIIDAISSLKPTQHRLELIEGGNCTIIDDAYNSNKVGMQEALEVLKRFDGPKIVITPGLVELGAEQSQANFAAGAMIADVADEIIIMNNVNKNELLSGAISHNFNRKHIYFADTRKKQKELLEKIVTPGCVLLFENDLPDNYR